MKFDHFIYKAAQCCKGRTINNIKNLVGTCKKHVVSRNVPFFISRPQVEPYLKHLYKWNIYPYF